MFTFRNVAVLNVHDGDTATFRLTSDPVDIGFGMSVTGSVATIPCRLLGMAARELAAPGGPQARDYLAFLLGYGQGITVTSVWWDESGGRLGQGLTVTSVKWDKYGGRFDGIVTLPNGKDCATEMIAAGYALPWDGKGAQPVPAWPITAR